MLILVVVLVLVNNNNYVVLTLVFALFQISQLFMDINF